jgi:hypothetical protein
MTRTNGRLATAALAAMLVLGAPVLSACGGAAQQAAEEAAGNAIGGNVDIGSAGVTVQDSAGNNITIGEDVTLPDNWPSEIPVYDGGKLSSVMIAGDGASLNAVWLTDASVADAAKAYGAALTAAGFTSDTTSSAGGMSGGDYSGNGYKVTVVSIGADSQTSLMINASKN